MLYIENLLETKYVQIALISSLLFFIIASPPIFSFMKSSLKKTFNLKVPITLLLIIHTIIFGILILFIAKTIIASDTIEGQDEGEEVEGDEEEVEGDEGEEV